MPESEEKTKGPIVSLPRIWILQGLTLMGILGALAAGFTWKGAVQTTLQVHEKMLREQNEKLDGISTTLSDFRLEAVEDLATIRARLDGVNEKINALQEWTRTITPRIVREEFDRELERLNATINELRMQANEASSNLRQKDAELVEERMQSARFRNTFSEIDSELSEIAVDLESLSRNATGWEPRLPERYTEYFSNRIERLQRRLDELKRRLTA